MVAFKGGTALRKVYAGAAGRFSTDLDFAVASLDEDAVIGLLVDEIDGTQIGPFTFGIETAGTVTRSPIAVSLDRTRPNNSSPRSTSARHRGFRR